MQLAHDRKNHCKMQLASVSKRFIRKQGGIQDEDNFSHNLINIQFMQVQTQRNSLQMNQSRVIDYKTCLYSCTLYRKKLLGSGIRYFYVFVNQVVITKKPFKEFADRTLEFCFELRVIWIFEEKCKLKGVIFKTSSFEYQYHGENSQLRFLKLHLAPFVIQKKITDEYKHINILGKGSFAMVLELRSIYSQVHYAGKCIEKKKLSEDQRGELALQSEISILRLISYEKHPNLLQLKEVYDGENSIYLIMDIAQGNTLNKFVRQKQFQIPMLEIQQIMRQTLDGIQSLHSLGIMHRDLKPDNLLFFEKRNINSLKIVDFGLAVLTSQSPYMYPKCGTPGYIAPEILKLSSNYQGGYSSVCDIFSLGCIFFMLLTGEKLFESRTKEGVVKLNKECKINWGRVKTSRAAKSLLQGMLQHDEGKRLTAIQCLNHEYFQKSFSDLEQFDSVIFNELDQEQIESKEINVKNLQNQSIIYGNPFIEHDKLKQKLIKLDFSNSLVNSIKEQSFLYFDNDQNVEQEQKSFDTPLQNKNLLVKFSQDRNPFVKKHL